MSKKSTATTTTTTSRTLTPLKRPSTRSLTSTQKPDKDKYTFQSDDEDHQTKPVLTRSTPLTSGKRGRGRPPSKTPTTNKIDEKNLRRSLSSSNIESDSSVDEISTIKNKPSGENISTGKKRGRKSNKMLSSNNNESEVETKTNVETENIVPTQTSKRRYVKKKTLSTDTNPKSEGEETATPTTNNNTKLSTVDEKDLMQFGSPQHQTSTAPLPLQSQQSDDDFSDDSAEFVWKGSSKLSIEILKRRIPKDEPRDASTTNQSDPTAQRKRAIIPRLTNFDALSGQPAETPPMNKRVNVETPENVNGPKKSSSVITLNNVFQNDFVPSYNDAGAKMTTTTTATPTTASSSAATTITGSEDKPRPRIYAVKSTTMKSRPQLPQQQQQHHHQQQQQPEIKRPKWMNDQHGKSEEEEDEDNMPPAGEEPNDYDYVPKGQYIPKRPSYRARGTYPVRRGTGMRGRPPGSRRQWHDDDDDDDYDQYEDTHSRYGPRKQTAYRSSRPMYDVADDNVEYEKAPRMSLTQAYRRNTAVRPPISSMSGQRRIAINNGNHPIYKPFKSSSYRPTPATLGLSTSNRRTSSTSRSPVSTISQSHHHVSSTMSKHYSDEDYYPQQNSRPTTNASGQTFVTKMNENQYNDVSNQSQIFFVNMPTNQEPKSQQQVLSVLTTDQQQQAQGQQQVLPVTVVQQVKLPMDAPKQKKILPKPSANAQNQGNSSQDHHSANNSKPFAWSRPPGRIQINNDDPTQNKQSGNPQQTNTDLDTMEAAHVLATAADVTIAADARRKAQQHDDDMTMIVEETPSTIVAEETIQCDNETAKLLAQQQQQQYGTITANIIDENGVEHTVYLSTEEAQQLLGSQGAIIVDSDGQPISIQQAPPQQTFVSPFALDQAQLQALLAQAGIDPNIPLTIEQVDPNQQTQQATLCTSPGGTQYTVLTQAPTQQQFILQTTTAAAPMAEVAAPVVVAQAPPPQPIAPKEDLSSPPTKRRAFAVKSTATASRVDTTTTTTPSTTSAGATTAFDDINANERPRRKIFATKSTVTPMNDDVATDEEGIIGTRAYHRNVPRK